MWLKTGILVSCTIMKQIILVIFLQMPAVLTSSYPMCANIEDFNHMLKNNTAMVNTFLILKDYGLVRCVQQCLFRARCRSINFDISTKICELNQGGTNRLILKSDSIFTEKSNWPAVCKNFNKAFFVKN